MKFQRERRWHWRTWNMLLQIQRATDGEDPRQQSGEMTSRGIAAADGRPEIKAFKNRGWIVECDYVEVHEDSGYIRELPVWEITEDGRIALEAAKLAGITVM